MKILVVGATGMLGFSLFKNLSDYEHLNVFGTVRNIDSIEEKYQGLEDHLIQNVDINNFDKLNAIIKELKPQVVLNCIGLIKQLSQSKLHIDAIKINSLLPHEIALMCDDVGAKLIHFSTDCVFNGSKGGYTEDDFPSANDLYGRSKFLGELNFENHLTLRTSIIGHELKKSVSLIDWFLNQEDDVGGFSKAIFSGLPTAYIAKLLADKILDSDLTGLYHLSVDPIDKYKLLNTVSKIYNKKIKINKNEEFTIDRSLNSNKLRQALNLQVPSWEELIEFMYQDYKLRYC